LRYVEVRRRFPADLSSSDGKVRRRADNVFGVRTQPGRLFSGPYINWSVHRRLRHAASFRGVEPTKYFTVGVDVEKGGNYGCQRVTLIFEAASIGSGLDPTRVSMVA